MTTARITLPELEQYLAKAADILRGSIDQADFKAYIFPLMFFKRISDVYLEEYEQALDESGGDHEFAAFAENHRFAIPEANLWGDVRNHTENIGTALQTAFREIEKANPETLYGIFGNANWTNKDKLPDRKLADLIEHFSTRTLPNAVLSTGGLIRVSPWLPRTGTAPDSSPKQPYSPAPSPSVSITPAAWHCACADEMFFKVAIAADSLAFLREAASGPRSAGDSAMANSSVALRPSRRARPSSRAPTGPDGSSRSLPCIVSEISASTERSKRRCCSGSSAARMSVNEARKESVSKPATRSAGGGWSTGRRSVSGSSTGAAAAVCGTAAVSAIGAGWNPGSESDQARGAP